MPVSQCQVYRIAFGLAIFLLVYNQIKFFSKELFARTIYNPLPQLDLLGSAKHDSFTKDPLNIVIFYPDDWRHDDIGGVAPVLKTPFLKKLASDGIRFTHNAVTTSICWISRATLFTGQYVSRHASTLLFRPYFASVPERWNRTWPYLLQKRAGYYVGHVGKWQYHNKDNYYDRLFDFKRFYQHLFWFKNGKDRLHSCDKTKNDAIEFLNTRPKDRPFALTVAFGPPKGGVSPGDAGQEFYELYQHAFFPEPYNMTHAYSLLPPFLQNEGSEARMRWKYRWEGPGKIQQGMKTYYALMSHVDHACGVITNTLIEQGIYENTMIIFTADNGEFRASHGLSDKWYPYQESVRVPLIIYDPRMPQSKRGTTDNALTLNVDLAETILGAAGIAADEGMQGRNIADLYLPCHSMECHRPWRSQYYYEFPDINHRIEPSSALVSKNWKYIVWPNHGYEQLFNLEDDPLEMNDLRNLSKFKGLMNKMRTQHGFLQRKVMEPIIPGSKCDPLWPPKADLSSMPNCTHA